MAKRILILGAGVMQGPALRLAKARGLRTVAVDGDPSAPCRDLADRFECIDLKDKEGIERFARSLVADGGLDGVLTAGTDFSASVAWVAERLGLPGIPYETALNASDKGRMRACFKAASVPSPAFMVFTEVPAPASQLPFSFPVVVKPVDNMGSRGCRRVNSSDELADAITDSLSYSKSGRAIVEEYMDGPEFSVDAIVSNGKISICGLADRHIFFPPYFIEMGHTIPSSISNEESTLLLDVFKAGVRALGIQNGAAKGDLKLTGKGPMIGEIAARLSGGYMSGWTYPYASMVQPSAAAIAVALGEEPEDLSPQRSWTCAERAFISIPGRIRSLEGLEEARSIPGVQNLFLRVKEQDRVAFPQNNVTKCGNVIASAQSNAEACQAADTAVRRILIRLHTPDTDTEAFLGNSLSGEMSFPPDAFILTPSMLSALQALPVTEKHPSMLSKPLALIAFPELVNSSLKDYVGRSVEEALRALRHLCSLELPMQDPFSSENYSLLGKDFWMAFIRGSYQGGAYFIDTLSTFGKAEKIISAEPQR